MLSWENAQLHQHQSSCSAYSSSGLRSAGMRAPQIEMCFHKPHLQLLCKAVSWQGCKPHLNHSGTASQRLKDEAGEHFSLPAQADMSHFSGLPAFLTQPHSITLHRCCCQHHLREVSQKESQQITALLLPRGHGRGSGSQLKGGSAVSGAIAG